MATIYGKEYNYSENFKNRQKMKEVSDNLYTYIKRPFEISIEKHENTCIARIRCVNLKAPEFYRFETTIVITETVACEIIESVNEWEITQAVYSDQGHPRAELIIGPLWIHMLWIVPWNQHSRVATDHLYYTYIGLKEHPTARIPELMTKTVTIFNTASNQKEFNAFIQSVKEH